MLHWDYKSNLFGKDILGMQPDDERAFIGNYRKLGYLKDDKILILDEQKNAHFYVWHPSDNSLTAIPYEEKFERKSISFYEVADDLYRNEGLKINIE
jgi:hypothetical protein